MVALACAFACGGLSGCGAASAPPATPAAIVPSSSSPGSPGSPGGAATVDTKGTASIAGMVTDSAKVPISGARVILSSDALADPRAAITAADGAFSFTILPAGAYSLSVSRTGFVQGQFGERRSARAATIALGAGEALTGVEVPLQRAGVIAGQILDEGGRPLAGARVDALESRMIDGRTALASIASAQSDDRGEFRLTGLPAGQFYVSALDPAFAHVGDETGALRYMPTYYPGVPSADQATRVIVTPGTDAPGAVFKLHVVHPAQVTGTIRTPGAHQLVSGAVLMRSVYVEGLATIRSQDVMIRPDGTFTFRNVPPGQYEIRARGDMADESPSLFATFRVTVDGQDVGNIELMLVPGARIEGRVVIEALTSRETPQIPSGLRVRAPLVDGNPFGETLTGDVRADGSYAVRGLIVGSHAITVEGLTPPWVVKSVSWHGQDITDRGISAESRRVYSDVRVTITDTASEISGVVQNSAGRAVADATVLIIPASPQFWTRTSRRLRILRSDAAGRYTVRGLPPGDYRAVASLDIDDADAHRPDLLQELTQTGLRITVTDLAALTVDLPLTSAPRLPHIPSR